MKLDVPFFSQLDVEVPQDIQRSVCTIASLKMILGFKKIAVSFMDLHTEATIIGGKEIVGWGHETLVRVLRNHDLNSYRQEFFGQVINLETSEAVPLESSSEMAEFGFEKIKKSIDQGNPVIVSVLGGFSQDTESKKSLNLASHIVVVSGIEDETIHICDPILENESIVSKNHFMNYWRKLAIFVE